MIMLNPFPDLLIYGFTALFVLRVTLGLMFISFAYEKLFRERASRIAFFDKISLRPPMLYFSIVSGLELVAGILLTIGLFTQIAALVTGVVMTLATIIKWRRPTALPQNTIEFYILLAIVSFVLVSTGAGAFAFDFPF